MKHNLIYNIKGGVVKPVSVGETSDSKFNLKEETYKPALMSDKKLLREICWRSYKKCESCDNYIVCEFGREAVRRKLVNG